MVAVSSLVWKEQVSTLKWDFIIQNHPIDEIHYFHRGIIQYSSSNIIQWIESKRRRGKINDPQKLFFVHCQPHFPVTSDQPCCHGAAHRVHFLPQRGIFGPFLRASTFSNANKKRNKANLKDHEGRNPWSVKSDACIICWCSCLVCFLPLVRLLRQQTIMAGQPTPALIMPYEGKPMVKKPLIRLTILGIPWSAFDSIAKAYPSSWVLIPKRL